VTNGPFSSPAHRVKLGRQRGPPWSGPFLVGLLPNPADADDEEDDVVDHRPRDAIHRAGDRNSDPRPPSLPAGRPKWDGPTLSPRTGQSSEPPTPRCRRGEPDADGDRYVGAAMVDGRGTCSGGDAIGTADGGRRRRERRREQCCERGDAWRKPWPAPTNADHHAAQARAEAATGPSQGGESPGGGEAGQGGTGPCRGRNGSPGTRHCSRSPACGGGAISRVTADAGLAHRRAAESTAAREQLNATGTRRGRRPPKSTMPSSRRGRQPWSSWKPCGADTRTAVP
jgi:hypothetical protein